MRRIKSILAATIFLLTAFVSGQQTMTNPNTSKDTNPALPPGPILGGMGTTNYIPIWASSNFLVNSVIYQTNGSIGIGTASPAAALDVNGDVNAKDYEIGEAIVLSIGSAADQNLFLGVGAGSHDVGGQGIWNTFTGANSGQSNTTGTDNTFAGYNSGASNTSGYANTFVGFNAGRNNVTGNSNTFTGFDAGPNNTGSGNSFFGFEAGLLNTNGYSNTFIGTGAGYSNTAGANSTFSGFDAGFSNTTGVKDTYFGTGAGGLNVTGSDNAMIGYYAGINSTAGNNDIYVGNLGCSYPCSESSTIRIGGDTGQGFGPQTATYIAGVYGVNVGGIPVQINSNGQLGAATSSLRFKEQVHDMGDSSTALMSLRPVTFVYKPEYASGDHSLQFGLIAEEVAKVYPELVAYDAEGKPYAVRYQYLSAMLLNEVQKQYRRAEQESQFVASQQAQIEAQQREIDSLRQKLQLKDASVEERLSRLEKDMAIQGQAVAQK